MQNSGLFLFTRIVHENWPIRFLVQYSWVNGKRREQRGCHQAVSTVKRRAVIFILKKLLSSQKQNRVDSSGMEAGCSLANYSTDSCLLGIGKVVQTVRPDWVSDLPFKPLLREYPEYVFFKKITMKRLLFLSQTEKEKNLMIMRARTGRNVTQFNSWARTRTRNTVNKRITVRESTQQKQIFQNFNSRPQVQ